MLGALAFGLYYTVAVAYFEPFHVQGIRENLAGIGNLLTFYLPVALALVAVSLALFRLERAAHQREGRAAFWLRWVALPLTAYAVAVALLWLYGLGYSGGNADKGDLAGRLLGTVALVGLLPLQLLLLTWPRRGNAARNPITSKQSSTADVLGGKMPVGDANANAATSDPSETANAAISDPSDPAEAIEASPAPGQDAATASAKFRLQPSHGESTFEIPAADLILAEAADNYCKLYYLLNGQFRTKMVRVTMRDVEAALNGLPGYHRCHRSFLVNAAMVEAVQGQSQAYRLKVRFVAEPVPVSRSFDVELLRAD